MKEQIAKAFYAGLGAASLTVDKVKEYGERIAKEFNLSEEEGRKFAEEMKEKVDAQKTDMKDNVNDEVKKVLEKLNVPTREEYDSLLKRVEALEGDQQQEEE